MNTILLKGCYLSYEKNPAPTTCSWLLQLTHDIVEQQNAHIYCHATINVQKVRINTKTPDGMALWRRYGIGLKRGKAPQTLRPARLETVDFVE
jgi:hypothetical protein